MPELTRSQVRQLDKLLDLIEKPEKYGCAFDRGDAETYQERAGYIVDAAVEVVDDLLNPARHDPAREEMLAAWRKRS